MHTRTQLNPAQFDIRVGDDVEAGIDGLFPAWNRHDRFGIVIHDPLGGVGASHLLQLAICAYYAADERRRGELDVYPEIFAFHVGGGHGSHADFDFWGPRREVLLGDDPQELLAAINDRGISRLAVPDLASVGDLAAADAVGAAFEVKEIAAFRDIIASTFAYSPTGRTVAADVDIVGLDRRTEQNPTKVLRRFTAAEVTIKRATPARRPLKEVDPKFNAYQAARAAELTDSQLAKAVALRREISVDGLARETYRRISADEALRLLAHSPSIDAHGPSTARANSQ